MNEITDGFTEDAIDDARKPGHELIKRSRLFRAVFQAVESRIMCDYDNGPEEESAEPAAVATETNTADESNTETEPTPSVEEASAPLQAALQAAVKAAPKKACTEPFNEMLTMMSLQNSGLPFPDGYLEHEVIRQRKAAKSKDAAPHTGQYL